jgi:hypothetical protein
MKNTIILLAALAIGVSACATKRHGRAISLTPTEAKYLDCKQIEIELEKNNAFLQDVSRESSAIDGRALLGILGDFGIGNAMETSDAAQSGANREAQLRSLAKDKGCTNVVTHNVKAGVQLLQNPVAFVASGFANVADVNKLPAGLGCKKNYEENFINRPFNRAVALSGYSVTGARWCIFRFNRTDAPQAALSECNKVAAEKGVAACKLYAVNNDVVWVSE